MTRREAKIHLAILLATGLLTPLAGYVIGPVAAVTVGFVGFVTFVYWPTKKRY